MVEKASKRDCFTCANLKTGPRGLECPYKPEGIPYCSQYIMMKKCLNCIHYETDEYCTYRDEFVNGEANRGHDYNFYCKTWVHNRTKGNGGKGVKALCFICENCGKSVYLNGKEPVYIVETEQGRIWLCETCLQVLKQLEAKKPTGKYHRGRAI